MPSAPMPAAEERARPQLHDALPFVVVAGLGLLSNVLPAHHHRGEGWLALALFAVCLGVLAISLRRPERSWVDPVPAYLFFLVIAFGRDVSGGSQSGLIALIALPLIWLAITGTRADLWVASLLTPLVFVVPLLVVGAPEYQTYDWRRAVGWTAFAVLVVPAIRRIVLRLARETQRATEARMEMEGIMRGARLSSIISTDLHGKVRSFSVGAEELLGYRVDEAVGRPATDFHDPAELVRAAEELGVEPGFAVLVELARSSAPSRTWTYVRADGARVFVRLALTELHDAVGEVSGYLGVAIDSTAAIETRKALVDSEARWRVLLDNLPDTTVLMLDADGVIEVAAGAGAISQGLHGTEGRPLSEVVRPESVAIFADLQARALRGEEATGELISTATATGAEHEITVTPLPDGGSGERHVLLLGRNVHAARVRERELLLATRRAERLFEDAPHGVAVLSLDGTVLQANAAMLAMTGMPLEEVQGQPLSALSLPGDDDLERHLRHVVLRPGASVETDWTLRNTFGDEVHVVLSSRALADNDDRRIDAVLVNVVDVSERRRYEQRLSHLADHDVLTGLANRRLFERELEAHAERCRRYGPTGAVLLLDLDHFKEVNDTLGHLIGDQLLMSIATLLRSNLRSGDVVARLGGDEFAILLSEGDREAARSVAASLVQRVRDHTAALDGCRRRVTASIGAVTMQDASAEALDILALADVTMYDAKDAGRDQYAMLQDEDASPPRFGARLKWKSRIERAMRHDEFVLHLQPVQDLRTGRVLSAEALIRLDDHGVLTPPARFVEIAERTGLMPALDGWVTEHAIEMLADLRALEPDFRLGVNLSGHSIGDAETERTIIESLSRHGVDPGALILEVTETAAVADVVAAREFAERMTALGCRFALDDFGAGFGSFYYLKYLLFDYVKIDGEFVSGCHLSDVDRTILRSIVGIARDLGKETIAEHVSDPAILDVVRSEGIDHAQGFLIGEPVPYDEFVATFLTAAPSGTSAGPLLPQPHGPTRPATEGRAWAGSTGS